MIDKRELSRMTISEELKAISKKKASQLSVNDIMEIFAMPIDGVPAEAIKASSMHQIEVVEGIMDVLQDISVNGETYYKEKSYSHIHEIGLYLLAEYRYKDAFDVLMKILSGKEDVIEYFYRFVLSEDMPRIIASLYSNQEKEVFDFISNKAYYAYSRAAYLDALAILVQNDLMDEEKVIGLVKELLANASVDDKKFVTKLVDFIGYNHYMQFEQEVVNLFNENKVDKSLLGDLEDFEAIYHDLSFKNDHLSMISDSYKDLLRIEKIMTYGYAPVVNDNFMSSAEYLHQKEKKVGRNEPCPCGSGKKYKKCCGK